MTFRSGDLLKEGCYDTAFEGVWGVLHTAAVVKMGSSDDAYQSIVEPSVKGTQNVLESAKKQSILKRYVHISSIAAVISFDRAQAYQEAQEAAKAFDETEWNTWSTVEKGDAYGYAKTQAEKAVLDDQELSNQLEAVVSINPAVVLGPCLSKSHATQSSARQVTAFLTGNFTPQGYWCWVDVRDVAKAAVRAFTVDAEKVNGQRFVLSANPSTHYSQLGAIIRKVHPAAKGSTQAPGTAIIVFALWLCYYLPFLKKLVGYSEIWKFWNLRYEFDTTKSKTILGIDYRSIEETCRDACNSIQALIADDPPEPVSMLSYFSVVS